MKTTIKLKCINKAMKAGLVPKEAEFDDLFTEAQEYILNNVRQKRYKTIEGRLVCHNGGQNMNYSLPISGYNEVQGDLWVPSSRRYEHLDCDTDGTLYLIVGK